MIISQIIISIKLEVLNKQLHECNDDYSNENLQIAAKFQRTTSV